MDKIHPIKPQKRVVSITPKKHEKVVPSELPRPKRESSKGLVSHIWEAWKCKNYDV